MSQARDALRLRGMQLHAKAGTLLAVAAMVAGCTGVPGRESQAIDIEHRIAAMPGVSDVDLVYDNGILEGTRFAMRVSLEQASIEQIGAVAAEIDAARGDDFAEYDQQIELDVADQVSINASTALPGGTAAVAALLRELDSRVAAQSINWRVTSEGTTKIDIRDASATTAIVDTVLQVFADRPLDAIEVNPPPGPGPEAAWWIRTRLSPEDKRALDAQLAAAAPATARLIVIRDGHIVQMNVLVPSPETAYTDIVGVIRALGAGPQRPLQLRWSWADDPARYGDLRWSGSVDIGNCDDPTANTGSADDLVPAARQFEQRIRAEYGPCPK